jgi:hypothetical protein
MNKLDVSPLLRRMRRGLLINVVAFCLLLTTTVTAWASVGKIFDAAGVLNQSQVKSAETSLRYPVDIYTTDNFSGSKSEFIQRAREHLTSSNLIVMAISVNPNFMTIVAGNRVPLSNAEADNVISAFRQGYRSSGSNFTSATVSALQSLQSAVGTGSVGGGSRAPASGSGMLNGLWCLVGLVILAALAFFVIKRRRSGDLPFSPPQYNQPYQQNNLPNYGPGSPPQQGGGINPLAAGGLGAALGGLLGYGLGKHQGEGEAREEQGYGDSGGGSVGDFGGDDNGGNFGGGSVGDFGGDDNGGNFGGGSVGDFGGGSDGGD